MPVGPRRSTDSLIGKRLQCTGASGREHFTVQDGRPHTGATPAYDFIPDADNEAEFPYSDYLHTTWRIALRGGAVANPLPILHFAVTLSLLLSGQPAASSPAACLPAAPSDWPGAKRLHAAGDRQLECAAGSPSGLLCKRPARFHWLLAAGLPARCRSSCICSVLRPGHFRPPPRHHCRNQPGGGARIPRRAESGCCWRQLCWLRRLVRGCAWRARQAHCTTSTGRGRSRSAVLCCCSPDASASGASGMLQLRRPDALRAAARSRRTSADGSSRTLPALGRIRFDPRRVRPSLAVRAGRCAAYDFWKERHYLAKLTARSAHFPLRRPPGSCGGAAAGRGDGDRRIVALRPLEPERLRARRPIRCCDRKPTWSAWRRDHGGVGHPAVGAGDHVAQAGHAKPEGRLFRKILHHRAYKEAGFKTCWLSNQMSFGKFDTPVSVFAKEADVIQFLNLGGFTDDSSFDQVLLPAAARTRWPTRRRRS